MQFTELGVLIRLCVGAIGTFCAILLWARTRDVAWVLVVTAVLLSYAAIIFDALNRFGLFAWDDEVLLGLPAGALARLVLETVPTLLCAIAFVVVLARQRLR